MVSRSPFHFYGIISVMPGLVPGIHVLAASRKKDVDGRVKPGHDEQRYFFGGLIASAVPSMKA